MSFGATPLEINTPKNASCAAPLPTGTDGAGDTHVTSADDARASLMAAAAAAAKEAYYALAKINYSFIFPPTASEPSKAQVNIDSPSFSQSDIPTTT